MNKTKKITRTAMLLGLIIIVQCLKNFSPFISGPLINVILLAATFYVGINSGILLGIITPITSYFIAGASAMSAIMSATHFTALPVIMLGNIIFIFFAHLIFNKKDFKALILGLVTGSLGKWLFMLLCADFALKPLFSENLGKLVGALSKMFGTLQLYSAIVGSIIFFFIFLLLKKNDKFEVQ